MNGADVSQQVDKVMESAHVWTGPRYWVMMGKSQKCIANFGCLSEFLLSRGWVGSYLLREQIVLY